MYFKPGHVSGPKSSDLVGSESPSKKQRFTLKSPLCLQVSETSVIGVINCCGTDVHLLFHSGVKTSHLIKLDRSVTVQLVWWIGEKV